MKMKTFLPLAAVLCAFTCVVGCAPAPEEVVKELMLTFEAALLDGDLETVKSCVLEEDQQMAERLAGMAAMTSEEDKAKALADMEANLAKLTIVVEGDKAYRVFDGKKEPGHFAVLVDGKWKIDLPSM